MNSTRNGIIDRVWSIVVDATDAYEADRDDFVRHAAIAWGDFEYRFMGSLGFGGKVWREGGKWRVSCYPEDSTPERDKKIREANERLALLTENP